MGREGRSWEGGKGGVGRGKGKEGAGVPHRLKEVRLYLCFNLYTHVYMCFKNILEIESS